jgi:PAT family beta-lactamase induction signal transducer AmpG
MYKRLLIVFILGFSSGLPLPLVSSTLQAWFSQSGISVMATGMLSLISMPYIYRVIWGPFLDKYSITSLGKRKSWILITQLILLIGFNTMAWYSPETYPMFLAFLGFLLACVSATQDMAIEAHRTEYLLKTEQALGASFAVFGYRLALLISGGLALIIAQHLGWAFAYRLMGFCMLLGMLATLLSPEPSTHYPSTSSSALQLFTVPIKDFLSRPGVYYLLFFIIFYKLGEAFTTTTSGIVMPFLIQGIGFSLETIGYVNKIMGVIAILGGGILAGVILLRYSLGNALFLFGLIQAVTNVLFVLLALSGKNLFLFAAAVICDNFAAGMGSTALVALFMRVVNKRFTATQFSLLAAFSTIPRVFSGPIAAWLHSLFGWVGLYKISVFLALLFIPFLFKLKKLLPELDAAYSSKLCPESV